MVAPTKTKKDQFNCLNYSADNMINIQYAALSMQ